jgi:nicotinamide mononucleotide (NMN) deamidase PncC
LISQWLAAVAGVDSEYFLAGVISTSLDELRRTLAISGDDAQNLAAASSHDSVVSVISAESVRKLTGADVGLAVAAFPPVVDAPDARIHVAIATGERTRRLRFPCASHPAIRQARAAKQALNALRLTLLGQTLDEA